MSSPLSSSPSPRHSGAGALALFVSFYTLALSLFSALARHLPVYPLSHANSQFPHSAFHIPHWNHPFFQFCRLLDRLVPLRADNGTQLLPPDAAPDPAILAYLAEQSRLELERLAGAPVDYALLASSLGARTSRPLYATADQQPTPSLKAAHLFSDAVSEVRQRVAAFIRQPRLPRSIVFQSAIYNLQSAIRSSAFRIPHSHAPPGSPNSVLQTPRFSPASSHGWLSVLLPMRSRHAGCGANP